MTKQVLLVGIIIVALFGVNGTLAFATTNQNNDTVAINQDMPSLYWVNTSTIILDLNFPSGGAVCSGMIIGNTNVTKITATYTLQKMNTSGSFVTIKTWSNVSVSDRFLSFEESYSVSKGYTYRLSVSATVVASNGSQEVVSTYVDKTY